MKNINKMIKDSKKRLSQKASKLIGILVNHDGVVSY